MKTCAFFVWQTSHLILMKFSVLLQPVGLLKLMLNLFDMNRVQWRELCLLDFVRQTFDIGFCLHSCESICFKLRMLIETASCTFWYQFKLPWGTLRVTGLWESLNLCILLESGALVDHVRERTAKKSCKYGEYVSLAHLLFGLILCWDCGFCGTLLKGQKWTNA